MKWLHREASQLQALFVQFFANYGRHANIDFNAGKPNTKLTDYILFIKDFLS